jgi:hypothetical protein
MCGCVGCECDTELESLNPHVEAFHRQGELNVRHCDETGQVGFLRVQREAEKTIARTLILQNYTRIVEVDHPKRVLLDELWRLVLGLPDGSSGAWTAEGGSFIEYPSTLSSIHGIDDQ